MDKPTIGYLHNGILLGHKKENFTFTTVSTDLNLDFNFNVMGSLRERP